MSSKVETKTTELCQAILDEIQGNGIRKRIDAFLADATARSAYESLMSRGQALQEGAVPGPDVRMPLLGEPLEQLLLQSPHQPSREHPQIGLPPPPLHLHVSHEH